MAVPPLRWLLLPLLLGAGYAVVRVGVGARLAQVQPALAVGFAPDNAVAHASLADRAIAGDPARPQLAEAQQHALASYRREAVASDGVRTLGFVADAQRRPAQARQFVRLSEQLSRRDLLGQLWLIEDAVRRGQVAEALSHYDTALRASRTAPDVLFGPLTGATADAALIAPMADILAKRPAWSPGFVLQAASTSPSPGNVARLISLLLARGVSVPPLAVQSVLGRLVQSGDHGAAWRLYAVGHRGVRPDVVRDPVFAEVPIEPTAFDWTIQAGASVGAAPVSDGQGTRLAFDAAVGTGGTVARQLLLLRPGGRYRLSFAALGLRGLTQDAPAWEVVCAAGDRVVTRVPLPNSESWTRPPARAFQVPADCPAQWLQLVLVGSDSPEGVHGATSRVDIQRIGGAGA